METSSSGQLPRQKICRRRFTAGLQCVRANGPQHYGLLPVGEKFRAGDQTKNDRGRRRRRRSAAAPGSSPGLGVGRTAWRLLRLGFHQILHRRFGRALRRFMCKCQPLMSSGAVCASLRAVRSTIRSRSGRRVLPAPGADLACAGRGGWSGAPQV